MKAKQTKRAPAQKELREDLKNRKAALEEKGYVFSLDLASGWEAVKGLDKFGVFGKLEELLDKLEGLEEAIHLFEKGTLPFRHALYLAKFPPETQKEILEKVKRGETAEIPRFWTKRGENDE